MRNRHVHFLTYLLAVTVSPVFLNSPQALPQVKNDLLPTPSLFSAFTQPSQSQFERLIHERLNQALEIQRSA